MNWTELVARVSARSGTSVRQTRRVLRAMVDVCIEALAEGDSVVIRDLFTLSSRWRGPSTLRSVSDQRKIRLDGRWMARFRPARRLRVTLAERTPQTWRDSDHQTAWRVAEALVGDLALYHGDKAPDALTEATRLDEVDAACALRFGPLWARVRQSYEARVSENIRSSTDYIAMAARSRWGRQATPRPPNRP
jgi:nucleoid DNA-binding protein